MKDETGLKEIIDKLPESVRFKFRKEVCIICFGCDRIPKNPNASKMIELSLYIYAN